MRSKVTFGVGALLTKKKMKCQRCGEYNDTGSGKPYEGPASRKYRKEWTAEQQHREPAQPGAPRLAGDDVAAELARLAGLHEEGVLTDEEFAAAKASALGIAGNDGAPLPPPQPDA